HTNSHSLTDAPTRILLLFFSDPSAALRDLHSFPTRRSSDLHAGGGGRGGRGGGRVQHAEAGAGARRAARGGRDDARRVPQAHREDRKSTRLNSSHLVISYAVFCLKKKTNHDEPSVAHCPT